MFEDKNDKIYNLIISNGFDKNNEYKKFLEKIYSKTNFLWKESISASYIHASEEFYEKVDCIILLAGLFNDNKEKFDELIKVNKKYDIPIILIRPYGLEEVPEKLEEIATSIVGWNANCIIDSIKLAINNNSNDYCE